MTIEPLLLPEHEIIATFLDGDSLKEMQLLRYRLDVLYC